MARRTEEVFVPIVERGGGHLARVSVDHGPIGCGPSETTVAAHRNCLLGGHDLSTKKVSPSLNGLRLSRCFDPSGWLISRPSRRRRRKQHRMVVLTATLIKQGRNNITLSAPMRIRKQRNCASPAADGMLSVRIRRYLMIAHLDKIQDYVAADGRHQ
jgi:phenylalanyl-tRNA synthetase beta subunit